MRIVKLFQVDAGLAMPAVIQCDEPCRHHLILEQKFNRCTCGLVYNSYAQICEVKEGVSRCR